MRADSTLRAGDERMSEKMSEFLDRNFYSHVTTDFERVTDRVRQVKGIDTIFTLNGHRYTCDEKCAVRYRNLNTFSLELSFINRRGDIQEGWLTSPKDINDSYLFVWVDDDRVQAALVRKSALMEHLETLRWTPENLRIKCARIREAAEDGTYEYMGNISSHGCKFCHSSHLVESPINIILPRKAYIQIADYVWTTKILTEKQFA